MSEVVSLKHPRTGTKLRIGFLRLTDSAPAIVAQEFGYFAEEGIDADLFEEPSWANIADKLAYGFLDAAVIVPPLAFAIEMGLRPAPGLYFLRLSGPARSEMKRVVFIR